MGVRNTYIPSLRYFTSLPSSGGGSYVQAYIMASVHPCYSTCKCYKDADHLCRSFPSREPRNPPLLLHDASAYASFWPTPSSAEDMFASGCAPDLHVVSLAKDWEGEDVSIDLHFKYFGHQTPVRCLGRAFKPFKCNSSASGHV